ncbi:hypothetical protein PYK79_45125 [Streptomyces sp. ID05-04B]|uniref:hypothetical protein n=1 Tax=unclassified Streptomyces TaxID=2593676 RepID=UPI000D1AFA33|nr:MULTISPECIES: hypothetical protein [unclassified Streptomyces]AVV46426.1 hypothetical protein C6376_38815 [Streptomyces sp. P3]AVV46485.1 hypothetical protein C6376_39115 [Streptomyces sp. P3]MDX5569031.1 hypothetical protein [Streptomyces sp. ID05-04B]
MTTASQTPGALPPEVPYVPPQSEVLAATPIDPEIPHRLRSPYPEPEQPECCLCSSREGRLTPDPKGRLYPSGARVLYCAKHLPPPAPVVAAEGVIAAAMKAGAATPRELAQAEYETGLLFDAQAAEDIAAAAAEQAHAEAQAAIGERGRQLAALAGDHRKLTAVMRLLEGRPGTHLLTVAEIAAAAEYGTTPFDSAPMTLGWTGEVSIPGPRDTHTKAVIGCMSSYGGRADLVVEGDARRRLASQLALEFRDPHAPCATAMCGTDHDLDSGDMFGWSRLEVASVGEGARWYCSDMCVMDALARAGHDLAAADRDAAGNPGEQDPGPLHGDDAHWAGRIRLAQTDAADGEDPVDDMARCARCGCTDAAACEGGCHWVANHQMADLCSRCASPAELAVATRGLE